MKYWCCKSTTGGATDTIKCIKCNHQYHLQCILPARNKRDTSPDFKKSWVCPECLLSRPKQPCADKDNTPVRASVSNLREDDNINFRRGGTSTSNSQYFHEEPIGQTSLLEQVRSIISTEITCLKDELRSSLAPLKNELKALKDEFSSMRESINFINVKFDDLCTRINKCESDLKTVSRQCSEFSDVTKKIELMEAANNDREQWSRRSNIEIYGVPQKKNENLYTILNNISDKVGYNLNRSTEIDFITRVASKSQENKKPKPIVVKFLCRWKKDDFLAQVKKLKLKCSDIGFSSNDNFIYFNDHLTSKNKVLLQSVKKIAKEKGYRYVWVKNCCIMVRRNDTSPVLHIINVNDLKKIQ
ncbi:unnamed protein product [Euphydryas editha]|uniref:Zinc finger PHD-type domain-containing protein n=1 Tax=Euphydryas editha TaxID=104508 RepID=A0AAU9U5C6_EUPED|nr:unnamed protein product [Euphydryas editha]CAH2094271.1 unnamed protein product [Euphydryas editha]